MSEGSQQSDVVPHAAAEPWVSEPEYREGAVDLLGVLAYGALAAFDRLAEDARRAPTLPDKVYVASLAALQIKHFDTVRARLSELDVDVMAAMKPFHAPFNQFHEQTKPKDWLEGLVLAYVGNGFATDFYREVAAFVDADTRAVVHQVLADEGHA
ncbi:MAG TPA: ferritin-like fold-containing protein, partial [Propionibacteriaceae bacterium]|nr:ferritin-like fold-containing protein [Propionibacteriaceae bacterium]